MRKVFLIFLGILLLTSILITGAFAQLEKVDAYVDQVREAVAKGKNAIDAGEPREIAQGFLDDARVAYDNAQAIAATIPRGSDDEARANELLNEAERLIIELEAMIESMPTTTTTTIPPSPGQVEFPSGGGIRMPYAMGVFGGSATDIQGASPPYLKDIKGQPVIGKSDDGTGFWGAGYVLWGVGTPPAVVEGETEAADDGDINQTRIERFNGHIKLYWNYNNTNVTAADIWRYNAGVDGGFVVETSVYVKIAGPISATEWEDNAAIVGDGNNYYYRVIPSGTPQANIMDPPLNKRTMGKVDVKLVAESKYTFVSYPFNAAVINMQDLIGDQLRHKDQVHWWDPNALPAPAYNIITKVQNAWDSDHDFQFGEGFLVYLWPTLPPGTPRQDVYLTLVGLVGNFAPDVKVYLGDEYYLVGYPYPVVRNALTAGFAPRHKDQIHMWTTDPADLSQEFAIATYVTSAWDELSLTEFALGESKFHYVHPDNDPYDWILTF